MSQMSVTWKCSKCGYTLQAAEPPKACPACKESCKFHDISCYLPECGGPGGMDPRLK
jgi:rubredoxin